MNRIETTKAVNKRQVIKEFRDCLTKRVLSHTPFVLKKRGMAGVMICRIPNNQTISQSNE